MKKITFKFKKSQQSDWSKFAHSSSFEDAKAQMKGVAGKHFMRSLVGALHELDKDFVVVSAGATEENLEKKQVRKQPSTIRLLNFSVDQGVTAGYEIMKGKIDGKTVYRKKDAKEKTYDKNIVNLMKTVYGTDAIKPTDLHSFINMLKLANKYLSKDVKQKALNRFYAILFCTESGQCQEIEPDDMEEDVRLKSGMYLKAVELLKLKEHKDLSKVIQHYVELKHKKQITEHFSIKPFTAFVGV